MGRSAHVVMASTSPRIKTRHPSSHGIYKSPSRLLRRSPRKNQPSPLLRRSLRVSQLRASALEATSAFRPHQRRRWNNWITGGSKQVAGTKPASGVKKARRERNVTMSPGPAGAEIRSTSGSPARISLPNALRRGKGSRTNPRTVENAHLRLSRQLVQAFFM